MGIHMKKTQSFAFLMLFLGLLISCGVFDNEQIPECLKQSETDPSGTIYCFQPSWFGRPDWHPDGEWIAAEHSDSIDTNSDGLNDTWFSGIWLVNAECGRTQPLLPFGRTPAWNPKGDLLAVSDQGRIYSVRITSLEPASYNTSSITLLTDFNASAFFPTWSSDGQWIAFDTNYLDSNGANVIWKIRKDGTGLTDISIHQVGEWRYANWNGTQIAHSRALTSSGWEIFVMSDDGSRPKQLTGSGENYYPKYSPGGKRIAYQHHQGIKSSIYIINSDGSNNLMLARDWASGVAWSPDGKKLVYVFANHYYDVPGNGQLWIMNANGSQKWQLTFNHGLELE